MKEHTSLLLLRGIAPAPRATRARAAATCAALSLVVMAGCGSEEVRPPLPTRSDMGMNGGGDMAPGMDMGPGGDMDPGGDMAPDTDMDPGQPDMGGGLEPRVDPQLCEVGEDKGELSAGSISWEGMITSRGDDYLQPKCSELGDIVERAFHFTVPEPGMRLDVTLTSMRPLWAVSLVEGCGAEAGPEESLCLRTSSTQEQTFYAYGGTSYSLVVEPRGLGEGSFELAIDASPIACGPPGSSMCMGADEVQRCDNMRMLQPATSCGGLGCQQGECGGDSCQNPALVVMGTGTQAFTAPAGAFGDDYNLLNEDGCWTSGSPMAMPGEDMIIALPGIAAGQTITARGLEDTGGDRRDYGLFLLRGDCQPTSQACVAGGNQIFDELSWQADAAGDYYLLVDSTAAKPGVPIEVEVTIE